MTKSRFKSLIIKQIKTESLKYLLHIRKTKGSQIEYKSLQMSDYLLPNIYITNIEDRQMLFGIRNDMFIYKEGFFVNKSDKCLCGELENIKHIYSCEKLDNSELIYPYNRIYNGTISEQKYIITRIKSNLQQRENKLGCAK